MEDSLTYAMSYAAGGLREAVTKTEKLQSVINFCLNISNKKTRQDSCAISELKATKPEFLESLWKKLKETLLVLWDISSEK